MWLPEQYFDEINLETDQGCSWNEIWHWTEDEIGIAVERWVWLRVELMAENAVG